MFASPIGYLHRPYFPYAVALAYLATNVAGLVAVQKGVLRAIGREPAPYTLRRGLLDGLVCFVYTAAVLIAIRVGLLEPFGFNLPN